MELEEVKKSLDADLSKSLVTTSSLMKNYLFLTEESRKTGAYVDPRYIPFYYHLGKYIKPKSMVEMGVQLALFSGAFFQSCKSVENYLGFQPKTKEYYSPRLAMKNLANHFKKKGRIVVENEDEFLQAFGAGQWELILVNQERKYDDLRLLYDTMWDGLASEGILVADYLDHQSTNRKAFMDFCKTKNRNPVIFSTRYGTGLIQK